MRRNLAYQYLNAIEKNLKLGASKHSAKKDKNSEKDTNIYSYASREEMVDFAWNISKFLKSDYPEIKFVKDVKSEHVQAFLNEKACTCSDKTLKQYVSRANKLKKLVNKTYNVKTKLDIVAPKSCSSRQSSRDKQMSLEHYKKLEGTLSGNGLKAARLAKNFGLRVESISKLQKRDFNLEEGYLNIVGDKGGRDRKIPFETSEQYNLAKYMRETVREDFDRVIPISVAGINSAIRRGLERVELKNEYRTTNVHSIRKLYAQETFDRYRKEGKGIEESKGLVSKRLGHSFSRGEDKDLTATYIKNIK